ncbi:hypothetical protein LSG25_18935 [Paralcaligenes sp. KSB-10]|uniref:hypothetical protein n=1 Tax=Paralcaligenes sp. KSB-10 TaxID=2901142 RepID=UPI001E3BE0AA|nr:hypothetical protein [Paralcaligenes sp. KSB-10]UHL64069.1 hypothetical protein LSG25_18935 [Paralcaligenes sp. KSB-10]
MLQFVADQVDQLDLALDQLAVRDRNFDRFAMMLIDNVVELTLHGHAREKASENEMWRHEPSPKNDPKVVAAALGQSFEAKVRLARSTSMIPAEVAESIQYLHAFRNTVYHQGRRHEGILHSLAIFYFQNACSVLEGFKPMWWSTGSRDQISHRAIKYLGSPKLFEHREVMASACTRLRQVGNSLGQTLIADLQADMNNTIERVDEMIDFLTTEAPQTTSRKQAIISAQAWPFAFSDEGKQWARNNHCPTDTVGGYVDWLSANYPWPVRADPISGWQKRLVSLKAEKDLNAALKKYCDFMRQTEEFRSKIDESVSQLDTYIQQQIDIARGK